MSRQTIIKAAGDMEAWALGIPYGSQYDKDAQGEWFTPETKLHDDRFPLPPVVHYHGMDKNGRPIDPEFIGETVSYEDRGDGRWYKILFDAASELARETWEGVKNMTAVVSSGSNTLSRVLNTGEIVHWPVSELSVWDNVSGLNPQSKDNAIAIPAKYQVIEQQAEGEQETAAEAETLNNEVHTIKADNSAATENNTMSEETKEKEAPQVEPVDVAAIASEAAKAAVKAYQAELVESLPVKSAGVEVVDDSADRALDGNPFKTPGEFYMEVKKAGQGSMYDERLDPLKSEMTNEGIVYQLPAKAIKAMKAPTGLSEVVPADGGFLVGTDRQQQIGVRTEYQSAVWNRAFNLPIGPNSNGTTLNMVDETSRADGSRWGGVRGYWLAEADEKTKSKPTFDQIEPKLKKVIALVYATDEVLMDATQLGALLSILPPQELDFQKDDKAVNGSGVGVPLGILNSTALVAQAAEGAQAAATVVSQNIINMYSRREGSPANYVWFINQEVEPQLHALNLPVGTGGALVYMPPGGLSGAPYGSLYGRPVIAIEQAAALGTVGDIMFVNMMKYLTINKGGVQQAESIHVRFIYDESVFRFVERVDGMPMVKSPLTPYKGSNTRSPFVALATRS